MRYCFQLLPHPNSFYRESQQRLGQLELEAMLQGLGVQGGVSVQEIGHSDFFIHDGTLTTAQLGALTRHSSLLLFGVLEDGRIRPIDPDARDWLPRSMAEVLKYKGKTSPIFTRLMLNVGIAAIGRTGSDEPLTVLDPMAGKCTAAFCALSMGHNAVVMDVDRDSLKEGMDFFHRYCERNRYKHKLKQGAETCGSRSVPTAEYTLSTEKGGPERSFRLLQGDAELAGSLVRKHPPDVIAADLPYGVQHSPRQTGAGDSFGGLLRRTLPSLAQALKPGGAMVLSFNTHTLRRTQLADHLREAGLTVLDSPPYTGFEHYVEQAVLRDLIVALR